MCVCMCVCDGALGVPMDAEKVIDALSIQLRLKLLRYTVIAWPRGAKKATSDW